MAESLRGGVIGAGVFGGYHARQYAKLPGVVLSAVLDPHPDRAAKVAVPLGGCWRRSPPASRSISRSRSR
jgi:predicted dehydrogenase